MSKAVTFCIAFVFFMSLLCYFTNTTFNMKAYANNLNNLPAKPKLPDWSEVSISFENVDGIKDAFSALGSFFTFIGDALSYPFQYIAYIAKTVYVLSNGMLEKE